MYNFWGHPVFLSAPDSPEGSSGGAERGKVCCLQWVSVCCSWITRFPWSRWRRWPSISASSTTCSWLRRSRTVWLYSVTTVARWWLPRLASTPTLQPSGSLYRSVFYYYIVVYCYGPSVLWRCWLGSRKGIRPVKNWVVGCWRGYLSGARCRLACGPAVGLASISFWSRSDRCLWPAITYDQKKDWSRSTGL